jgi:hypothetical protein
MQYIYRKSKRCVSLRKQEDYNLLYPFFFFLPSSSRSSGNVTAICKETSDYVSGRQAGTSGSNLID